jgi:uncharacterized protein YjbI with pentapeptide repeats
MRTSWRCWSVALIATALAFVATPAVSCICTMMGGPELTVMSTPIAFRGRVVDVETMSVDGRRPQRVTMEVDQVWKGDLPGRIEFDAGGPTSCDVRFSLGDEGAYFAIRRSSGVLSMGSCQVYFPRRVGPELDRLAAEVAAADAATRAAPGAPVPLLARAEVLRRWRDHERALLAYRAAADVAPDLVPAQVGIGRSLIAQRRAEEALVSLEEARLRLGAHPDIVAAIDLARVASGDFSNVSRTDFRGADLTQVNLSRQALGDADFSGAYLDHVRFEQSDLQGARFIRTRFFWSSMPGADLRRARFVAPIGFPILTGADLRDAWLERIEVPDMWAFRDVDMRGATLLESRFRGTEFSNVNLARARLTTVHMSRVFLIGTNLQGAVLRDVTFEAVGMFEMGAPTGRSLEGPRDLPGTRLNNVRFQ